MGGEVGPALQTLLLTPERDEQDGPFRFVLLERKRLGHLNEHGPAAGIVVGARKQPIADLPQVIVMRGQDNPLVAKDRIATWNNGPDVPADEARPALRA